MSVISPGCTGSYCAWAGRPNETAILPTLIVRRELYGRDPGRKTMPLPTLRLDGLAALVTGAGSGIGRAPALGLAENGADVALTELPGKLSDAEAAARK